MTKHAFDKLSQITQQQSKKNKPLDKLLTNLKGKPFYCHKPFRTVDTYCCCWHTFPPKRPDGSYSELYPFQDSLIQTIQDKKRVALLKARGIGATFCALEFGLYLTLCEQKEGNYMFLTGVGYTLSRTLRRRAAQMLKDRGVEFDDNASTLTFPHCRWSFYGSDSKSYLGQESIVYVVADEIAVFDPYSDWSSSINTFAIKNSGATMFLITTPSSNIDSQAYHLFKVPDDKSLYYRVYLNYKAALGTMLEPESIQLLQKTSESFKMMYDLAWGYSYEGSVFHESDIKYAIELGKHYNPLTDFNPNNVTSCGIDFGFGSSPSGLCISQLNNGIVQILFADEIERPSLEDILHLSIELFSKYQPDRVFLDGSATELVDELKRLANSELGWNEEIPFRQQKERCEKLGINFEQQTRIVPIAFNKSGKRMLVFSKMALEKKLISINEDHFPKLIASLRTAKERDGILQKSVTKFDNVYDAYRMNLRLFEF